MARFSTRDPRTGRWTVDMTNTPVDSRFDPMTGIDVSANTDDHAYDMVPGGENVVSSPAAPPVTDEPEAEPLHFRRIIQETGLRDPYGRVDQRLVQQAQAGTDYGAGCK